MNDEIFRLFTKAMRAADVQFESGKSGGGGTRHYLHDCLIPELQAVGLRVVREAEHDRLRAALQEIADYTSPDNVEHDPFGAFVVRRMAEMATAALNEQSEGR